MRVLVTGGSGRLGEAVVRDLLAHGHDPANADRRPLRPEAAGLAPWREADLGDVG